MSTTIDNLYVDIDPNQNEPIIGYNPDSQPLSKQEESYNDRYKQDTAHRKTLVIWVMCVVSIWLIAVLAITILCQVSDNVKITLLATTTVNILGLPLIILKGLFNDEKKK